MEFLFDIELLYSKKNRTVFLDDKTTAEIDFVGKKPENASIKSNLFRAVDGKYNFDPMIIIQMPGTYALLNVDFGNFGAY